MRELPLNIIDFIRHPDVLNDQSLSKFQLACHKTLYGLPLDETELEIHQRCTGRDVYVPREYTEMSYLGGRRSRKSSRLAAPIAIFEAFRDHRLPRGEKAYVLLIAPTKALARIDFHYIQRYLLNSVALSKEIVKILKNEVVLSNGITIGCYPCSYVAVRGITIVAAICDEMAFWRHEETAANPEQEILAALRPGMATVEKAKLIKLSTPFRKRGVLWEEFQRRSELDFPVWQASTFEMNPTISPAALERERKRDEPTYRREYLAVHGRHHLVDRTRSPGAVHRAESQGIATRVGRCLCGHDRPRICAKRFCTGHRASFAGRGNRVGPRGKMVRNQEGAARL